MTRWPRWRVWRLVSWVLLGFGWGAYFPSTRPWWLFLELACTTVFVVGVAVLTSRPPRP